MSRACAYCNGKEYQQYYKLILAGEAFMICMDCKNKILALRKKTHKQQLEWILEKMEQEQQIDDSDITLDTMKQIKEWINAETEK